MPHVEAAHAGQTKLTLKGVQLFSRVLHQLSCPEKQGEMSDQILPATALIALTSCFWGDRCGVDSIQYSRKCVIVDGSCRRWYSWHCVCSTLPFLLARPATNFSLQTKETLLLISTKAASTSSGSARQSYLRTLGRFLSVAMCNDSLLPVMVLQLAAGLRLSVSHLKKI